MKKDKISIKLLPCLLTLMLGFMIAQQVNGQVVVRVKMDKSAYLVNQSIKATVFITNNAGRQLVFAGNQGRPWLNFHLTANGRAIPIARRVNYKPVVIPVGQTIQRKVNLSASYSLTRLGNYSCQASVNQPGPGNNAFPSNRTMFTVANGQVTWARRVGIPSAPGETREFQIVSFSGDRKNELFARVNSVNTGQHVVTIPLGNHLMMRKPLCKIDARSNLHTLYQVQPDVFSYVIVSPKGRVLKSSYHKRAQTGNPRLEQVGNEVMLAGGIPHDPQAEAENAKKIRNISERPAFLFKG